MVMPDEPLPFDEARWPDFVRHVLWGHFMEGAGFWRFHRGPHRVDSGRVGARFTFGASVMFPRSDLKRVVERLRAAK
jgi:hypothetical protein